MRRISIWMLGIAVVVAFAGVAVLSDVQNSPHNLSSTAGTGQITDRSTDEDEICIFCHTPHNSLLDTGLTPIPPLWNHTMSSTASYGVYDSTTFDGAGTISDIGGGTEISNLCMSCHDGTVGVNDLGNFSDVGQPTMGSGNELNVSAQITTTANLGTDLSNDHPINFTYDAALATADGELATPVSAAYVDADPGGNIPLFGATLQCATCHDPHDNTNVPFLVVDNAGSNLCTQCHQK